MTKILKSERLIRREALDVLKDFGATDFKSYSLINNWGYTFKINGIKFDARFWENMYGFSPMKWGVHMVDEYDEKYKPLMEEIENELNYDHHGKVYLEERFKTIE